MASNKIKVQWTDWWVGRMRDTAKKEGRDFLSVSQRFFDKGVSDNHLRKEGWHYYWDFESGETVRVTWKRENPKGRDIKVS